MDLSRLEKIQQFISKKKGIVEDKQKDNAFRSAQNKALKKQLVDHEKALQIVKEVGRRTQEQLQIHISDITSLALEAVMPEDPYRLVMEFVERRDQTECDLRFERNGVLMKPTDASGVGAIDTASFALRIAAWNMQSPKSRNVIILDEPFKFLDKSKHDRASAMIKELSTKLGIQFIIVTHEEKLTQAADKVFKVTNNKGVSKVTEQ